MVGGAAAMSAGNILQGAAGKVISRATSKVMFKTVGKMAPESASRSVSLTRRHFLAAAASTALCTPAIAEGGARIVVIGGGFGGAACARTMKQLDPRLSVTLVEANRTYTACPLSNNVIAGLRDLSEQHFTYEKVAADGVTLAFDAATAIDAGSRTVLLKNGTSLFYDRLVIAPGISFDWNALPRYDEAASRLIPHAWKAGEQTALLRRQLEAMEDGGTVLLSVPENPMRCPPGAYERASLIAHYLKTRKPRSKIIVLDAKDEFSMQRLFQNAWRALYPKHLEWIGLSDGGKVTSVDVGTRTLTCDFESHKGSVVNIIPRQKAGEIAQMAGVTDRTNWCPVDPITFESKIAPNIHVIGDAALVGTMPKSAFGADAQAKICAAAIIKLLANATPIRPKLINACYSLAAPEYGLSVVGVYQPVGNDYLQVEGAGGNSPLDAPHATRVLEANYAHSLFRTLTSEIFG
jgi:NADPH-dependent 2,4-dienoyl-CoA reductase/sulfur reductase-like enzyme